MRITVPGFTPLALALPLLSGCAGPTTPLGSVWVLTPRQAFGEDLATRSPASSSGSVIQAATIPQILFTPSRQVLHGPASVRVRILDPSGDFTHYKLNVRYNGVDVSRSFLRHSRVRIEPEAKYLEIDNPEVRLPAVEDHRIEMVYQSASGAIASARYKAPVCNAFHASKIRNVADFRPDSQLLDLIARLSSQEGFNPAFFTALIAQESGFNPKTISWAKAIGLTQMTSRAEAEVIDDFHDWPRYPRIESYPLVRLKYMVMTGKINGSNEWRLDPSKSVEGGIMYARYLSGLWSTEANTARIRKLFPHQPIEIIRTKLILASYHSGYTRVSAALDSRGRRWLFTRGLKEARKYVNRIFSYCNYFIEGEDVDARET
jgi:hypothetical protein